MQSSLYLLLLNAAIACVLASTGYHERLLLRPLPQGSLLASFNFASNETQAAVEEQNFRYFPRSLGQILQHAHTKELHLRFSVGRWDPESWGQRPWNGAREGGTGVELWAWVEAQDEDEYDFNSPKRHRVLTGTEHLPAGSPSRMPSLACSVLP
jgi:phosphatidylinositol glycan class T